METRKHPTFHKNVFTKMAIAFLVSLSLFLNVYFFEGRNFLAGNIGILLMTFTMLGAVSYGFWAGNHVKCPVCYSLCDRYSDEENRSRKVICNKCKILWILGVSYNHDTE